MLSLHDKLNLGQEIFLVVFSILYGVLLQSLPKGLFQLASSLRGKKFRSGIVTTYYLKIWRKRAFLSIFIFNFMPAVYLFKMLLVLQIVPLPPRLPQQFIYIIFVFWFALGVFGFYRIFHIIVIIYWRTLFKDMIEVFDERNLSYNPWSNLFWVHFYLSPGLIWFILSIPQILRQ